MASPMQPSATTQSDISKLAKKMAASSRRRRITEASPRCRRTTRESRTMKARRASVQGPDLIREVGIIKKVHEVIDEDGKEPSATASNSRMASFSQTSSRKTSVRSTASTTLRRWTPIFPDDAEYDAAVAPLLPAEPRGWRGSECQVRIRRRVQGGWEHILRAGQARLGAAHLPRMRPGPPAHWIWRGRVGDGVRS